MKRMAEAKPSERDKHTFSVALPRVRDFQAWNAASLPAFASSQSDSKRLQKAESTSSRGCAKEIWNCVKKSALYCARTIPLASS